MKAGNEGLQGRDLVFFFFCGSCWANETLIEAPV